MSIIINGMDMPKGNSVKNLLIYSDGRVFTGHKDDAIYSAEVQKIGKWIVVKRHEHYPSGKPYEQLRCPFCKRFDHNGDGNFCGYCGADMKGEN